MRLMVFCETVSILGCVGGICHLAGVLGPQVCQLYKLFKEKDLDAAVELQRRLILPNTIVKNYDSN